MLGDHQGNPDSKIRVTSLSLIGKLSAEMNATTKPINERYHPQGLAVLRSLIRQAMFYRKRAQSYREREDFKLAEWCEGAQQALINAAKLATTDLKRYC